MTDAETHDGRGGASIEWLDVVDADNRVVGRAPRDVAHRDGLLHRSVHLLLLDGAGRVFVQRRSDTKDTNPGLWDSSAAGHVDSGESPLAAAVRELREELGVRVPTEALDAHRRARGPHRPTGSSSSRSTGSISDDPLTLEEEEIAEGRWLEPAALLEWMAREPEDFTDVFREVWRSARPDVRRASPAEARFRPPGRSIVATCSRAPSAEAPPARLG